MSPVNPSTGNTGLVDKDLDEQARPGHGIPSQDPETAAQSSMNPEESRREAHSVLAGGGVIVGAATGAAIGTLVAGPLGAVVAGTLGAVAGALGGAAAGPLLADDAIPEAEQAPASR